MKQKDLAKFYQVTERTVRRWKSDGAPLDNPKRMVSWLLTRKRIPKGAQAWMDSQSLNKPGPDLPMEETETPEIVESTGEVKELEERRIDLDRRLDRAMASDNESKIKLYTELLVRVDESLRRDQAHQKKLGLDTGEMMPRGEVERIMRAAFYAGNACVEGVLQQICEQVVSFDFPEEAYHYLKPILLGGRLFSGFSRVAKVPGPPQVPQWLIDTIRAQSEQYFDNPEAIWGECDTKFQGCSTDKENTENGSA